MDDKKKRDKVSDAFYRYVSLYLQLTIDIFDDLLEYPSLDDMIPNFLTRYMPAKIEIMPSKIEICKEIRDLCYSRNLIYNNLKD